MNDAGLRPLPEYEPPADDSAERTRQAIDRPTFVGRARQGIDVLMDQADPNPPTSCLDALDRQRQINGWVPPADPYSGGIPDDRVTFDTGTGIVSGSRYGKFWDDAIARGDVMVCHPDGRVEPLKRNDLPAFLRARLAEQEQKTGRWATMRHDAPYFQLHGKDGKLGVFIEGGPWQLLTDELYNQLYVHDPDTAALADLDAKRRIIDEHREEHGACRVCAIRSRKYRAPCRTLRLLAEPYADHPDYQPAWRIE